MFDTVLAVLGFCSPIASLITILAVLVKPIREKIFGLEDIREGQKCILRSEMLSIYYEGKDDGNKLRQHKFENFVLMYKAYKAMKGNSFIDKIAKEVEKMEVVT